MVRLISTKAIETHGIKTTVKYFPRCPYLLTTDNYVCRLHSALPPNILLLAYACGVLLYGKPT
jgi:hypothetical protein